MSHDRDRTMISSTNISPEVKEDAERYQELLLDRLLGVLVDSSEFDPERWPFSPEQNVIVTACAYGLALRFLCQAIRSHVDAERAEREIMFILHHAAQPLP